MKTLNLLSLVFLLFIWGCNNTKQNKSIPESESITTVEKPNPNQVVKSNTNEKNATQKKLLETKPLSDEELQNWFPKTIQNLNQKSSQKGTLKGIEANGASAFYEGSNNKTFTLSITDCAGKSAVKIYKKYARYKKPKDNHEDDTSITHHFNKDGRSGKSVFVKPLNQFAIDFLYKDRLAITVSTQNLEQENVYRILDSFPFQGLLE
ncbi:hypothetical protein [Patiriisocius hiemis]|uniref:Uncharacterized protein n=1 Tax=Patiriisocius hiemis TaxID=3075604 RepID=A0ABU2YAI6_9FLAO|nr:hypothetical protein [Constantimarinum sp. W242]MDT0555196.1 hypothetical protein [Constantimarinum sp. W242]